MGQKQLLPYRQRVVTGAASRVLEIGIGSGLNLPFHGDAVEEIIRIDISPELLAMAERAAALASRRRVRVRLLEGSAEPNVFNALSRTAASTRWSSPGRYAASTAALAEAHRVLRPGGSLRASSNTAGRPTLQWLGGRTISPHVEALFGGCHLNRQTDDLLAIGGVQGLPSWGQAIPRCWTARMQLDWPV